MKPLVEPWVDSLSLSSRITLGVLLLGALATLVEVYLINTTVRSRTLAELGNRLQSRANFMVTELQGNIDELRNEALFLSNIPPMQGIARASLNQGTDPRDRKDLGAWKQQLTEVFTAFLNANPDFYLVRYIGVDDGGRELVRVGRTDGRPVVTPENKLQQEGEDDYFRATLRCKPGEVYLSEINLNRERGKLAVPHIRTLRAAAPVYMPDGRLFGMVVINMDMGPALGWFSENLPEGVRAYLVNSEGDYLVHPDSSRAFGFDLGIRHRWQDDVSGVQPTMVQGATNMKLFSLSGELMEGVQRELHFDPRWPQRYLTLVYAIPDAVIGKSIAETRNVVIAGAVGVAMLVGILLFLYVRSNFAPLVRLTHAARAIGAGRHDTPLPASGGGEIGTFVSAFKEMLAGIREGENQILKLNQELERRVEQRTAELQQASVSMREALDALDACFDGAFIFAPETFRFSYVNEGAVRQVGYSHDTLLQMTLLDIEPEFDEQQFREMIAPLIKGERQFLIFETLHRHCDGFDIPVEVNLQYVARPGALPRFISIVRDITERREAEGEQQQLTTRLAASNQELERFAYVASHDLQEPLRTVASYLQLVERRYKDKLDDDGREFIDFAVDGAHRMQDMVKDLLEYSRVQTRGAGFSRVNLNAVLAEILSDLKIAIGESGATISHNQLPTVTGDASQLRRLLQNLIGNALKYRAEKAPRIRIYAQRIETSRVMRPDSAPAMGWLISVKDDGIGIEATYFEKIFQLFQRLHTRKEYPGTGLGLALCRRIVERHGGAIWVNSKPGKGSTFYVALPN